MAGIAPGSRFIGSALALLICFSAPLVMAGDSTPPGQALSEEDEHKMLGYKALDDGHLQSAMSHFRQATNKDFRDPENRFALGAVLQQLYQTSSGQSAYDYFHEMEMAYQAAIDLNPSMSQALSNWGMALADRALKADKATDGQRYFSLAVEKFEKALAITPGDHAALTAWGGALAQKAISWENGDPQKLKAAFAKFEKAASLQPKEPSVWYNWGTTLMHIAQSQHGAEQRTTLKDALKKFESGEQEGSKIASYLNNWGEALVSLAESSSGKERDSLFQDAFAKFEQSMVVRPGYGLALGNLVSGLEKLASHKSGDEKKELLALAQEKKKGL